jgi:hypothetical protein
LPALGMPAQRRPGPRRRLERVLHQVRGELAVTAGPHARVAEQPSVVRREEGAQPRPRDAAGSWAHRYRPCRTSAGRAGRTGPEFTERIMIM